MELDERRNRKIVSVLMVDPVPPVDSVLPVDPVLLLDSMLPLDALLLLSCIGEEVLGITGS